MTQAMALLRAELAPNACDLFGLALVAVVVMCVVKAVRL